MHSRATFLGFHVAPLPAFLLLPGPLESFKNRWTDPRFKELATALLALQPVAALGAS